MHLCAMVVSESSALCDVTKRTSFTSVTAPPASTWHCFSFLKQAKTKQFFSFLKQTNNGTRQDVCIVGALKLPSQKINGMFIKEQDAWHPNNFTSSCVLFSWPSASVTTSVLSISWQSLHKGRWCAHKLERAELINLMEQKTLCDVYSDAFLHYHNVSFYLPPNFIWIFPLFSLSPPTHLLAAPPNLFQSGCSFIFFFPFCQHKLHQPFVASGEFCWEKSSWAPGVFSSQHESLSLAGKCYVAIVSTKYREWKGRQRKKNQYENTADYWFAWWLVWHFSSLGASVMADGRLTAPSVFVLFRFSFFPASPLSLPLLSAAHRQQPESWSLLAFSNLSLSLFLWQASVRLSVRPPCLTSCLLHPPPPPPLSPRDEWRYVARQALPRARRSV